jgi:hypothetical protein
MGSRKNDTTQIARIASTAGMTHQAPPHRAATKPAPAASVHAVAMKGHPSGAILTRGLFP